MRVLNFFYFFIQKLTFYPKYHMRHLVYWKLSCESIFLTLSALWKYMVCRNLTKILWITLIRLWNGANVSIYVTWSRGMSRMSELLILSYRLKDVINSCVLHCFWIKRIVHISATRCPIEMGFGSKCSILNGQVIYIEKSKLNIADMWLIPLDCVTYEHVMQFDSNSRHKVSIHTKPLTLQVR